ncbi:hypothetical protein [Desulfospira joergensenii]|uniref:hypothetical protein n=1 Tax=Desulfospira joergensenii TaxID=53329 RepID=UPI0003B5D220|nr:hypothetical protein [Desulfospira joergensenii]
MAPIIKLFFKIFFATSIPFGLIMGLLQWPVQGPEGALKIGFQAGAGFGLIVSLITCTIHFITKRKANLDGASEKAAFSKEIDLPMTPDRAFDLVLEGLNRVKKCETTLEDRGTGRIEAEAGQTWKSWGEAITADVTATEPGRTQVKLSSRSQVRTTLVDFGKNQENVRAILSVFP